MEITTTTINTALFSVEDLCMLESTIDILSSLLSNMMYQGVSSLAYKKDGEITLLTRDELTEILMRLKKISVNKMYFLK